MLETLLLIGSLLLVGTGALIVITATAVFAWHSGGDDHRKKKKIK